MKKVLLLTGFIKFEGRSYPDDIVDNVKRIYNHNEGVLNRLSDSNTQYL